RVCELHNVAGADLAELSGRAGVRPVPFEHVDHFAPVEIVAARPRQCRISRSLQTRAGRLHGSGDKNGARAVADSLALMLFAIGNNAITQRRLVVVGKTNQARAAEERGSDKKASDGYVTAHDYRSFAITHLRFYWRG